jgi:translation initiation factor IF-1
MAGTGAFKVEGVIVEVLENQTYRVELANGHRLLGFVAGRARLNAPRRLLGETVILELSPCDLSEGRILPERNQTASVVGKKN